MSIVSALLGVGIAFTTLGSLFASMFIIVFDYLNDVWKIAWGIFVLLTVGAFLIGLTLPAVN